MSAQPFFDRLSKARDASIISPTNGQTLGFDAPNAKWENVTITSSTEGLWNFSTSTTIADPGSGKLRVNNATVSAATQMAISVTTQPGTDVTNVFKACQTGDQIMVQDRSNSANWIRYTVASAPTNNTSWFLIPITFVSGSGTTSGNNNLLVVAFQTSGPGGGGGGSGTVTNFSAGNLGPLFTTSVANPSTTPNLSFSLSTAGAHAFLGNNTGSTAPPAYVQPAFSDLSGSATDAQIPDILTVNKISNLTGNGFVKTSGGDGTVSTDTSTYLTGNQTITLSGDTTGSGTTAITTTLANIPDVTPAVGSILHTNIAAPTTPAAGKTKLYVDSTSKNIASKNDAGTVNHGIQSRTATASNWIRAIADDGTTTISQPAFSDVSGAFTLAQSPSTTASKLIGRGSSGAGAFQEITLGTNLSMTGTTLDAAGGAGSGTVTQVNTTSPVTGGSITTTGTIGLDVNVDHAFTATQSIKVSDALTSSTVQAVSFGHNSSGTPVAGFGTDVTLYAKSSNTNDRLISQIRAAWIDPTDATRTAKVTIQPVLNGAVHNTLNVYGSGGVGVDHLTDPGAGIVSANTGYWVGAAASTSGKIMQSDGSKFAASTPTWPTAASTAGKVVISDGTNLVTSTPTFPNASATSRKKIVSDGTNWVASTETWAVPGTSGNILQSDGTNWTSVAKPAYASLQTGVLTPTGTTSTAGLMAGLGGTITPSATGKILVTINGSMYNTNASGGATCAIRYGTGTVPSNGAALTGTQIGASAIRGAIAVNERMPFSVSAVITGLAVGTQVWLDVIQAALSAGTAVLVSVSIAAVELP
jgi:hypothetical protein